jgi:hypothetical protein
MLSCDANMEIICVNLRNLQILFRLLRRFYDERIGREVDPAKGQKQFELKRNM